MVNSNFEYKRKLLKMLDAKVKLERDQDGYRLDMSCALPGGTHSEKLPLRRNYSSNK